VIVGLPVVDVANLKLSGYLIATNPEPPLPPVLAVVEASP
jgi:hypothetical protein